MIFFLNQNIALVVWLILAALVFTACGGGEEIASTEQPEPVETAVPKSSKNPRWNQPSHPVQNPLLYLRPNQRIHLRKQKWNRQTNRKW